MALALSRQESFAMNVVEPLPEPEQEPKPTTLIEIATLSALAVSILCLLLFAWLASEMREGDTLKFDAAVRGWVHQFASPTLTRAMIFISLLGYDVLIAELVLALSIFLWLRWKRGAGWLLVATVGGVVLDVVLKYSFHRQRPAPFFGDAPHSYSFPSGHALVSFCFYVVLAGLIADRVRPLFLRILLGVIAAVLVISIGISRIYLGVHYPSDVLAGYLAAAMWVGTILTLDRIRERRRRRA
jgi:membrane-associated phospholipid phosphatase